MSAVKKGATKVEGTEPRFDPPPGLSAEARTIWAQQVPSLSSSPGRLALLRIGLHAMDQAEAARDQWKREGMTITTPAGRRVAHPAVAIERAARADVLRIWRTLRLEWCQPIDGKRS